jgi:hypothetical protein
MVCTLVVFGGCVKCFCGFVRVFWGIFFCGFAVKFGRGEWVAAVGAVG